MPFIFAPTEISDIIKIESTAFSDARGSFSEIYKNSDFKAAGINFDFSQDNFSVSAKGVLRGLHYQQEPYAQGKLVRVLSGKIFDVAVDIRKSSATYGHWVGEELSDKNNLSIFIPPGFAHGFMALEDNTYVVYKICGSEYMPEFERGIIYNDFTLNIPWPLPNPIVSEKDLLHPGFKDL